MTDEFRGDLFTSYAEEYFAKYPIFKHVADRVGDNSFFITGATGLFGSWILAFLNWTIKRKFAEPKIAILSRNKTSVFPRRFNVVEGDVRNFRLDKTKYDYFIHLAAPSALDTNLGMNDLEKFDILSTGTRRVLDLAQNLARKRVLVASSGAVFGGFDSSRVHPISECDLSTLVYDSSNQGLGLGKKVAEFITRDYCLNGLVDASVARCFSFVGPGLPTNLHYAVGNFVADAITTRKITIEGNGLTQRSYMDLGDMVLWLLTILFDGRTGEDYNVGSNDAVTLNQLASKIQELVDESVDIEVLGKTDTNIGVPANFYYVPNVDKAIKQLDLKHLSNLNSSLAGFIKYRREIFYGNLNNYV